MIGIRRRRIINSKLKRYGITNVDDGSNYRVTKVDAYNRADAIEIFHSIYPAREILSTPDEIKETRIMKGVVSDEKMKFEE